MSLALCEAAALEAQGGTDKHTRMHLGNNVNLRPLRWMQYAGWLRRSPAKDGNLALLPDVDSLLYEMTVAWRLK